MGTINDSEPEQRTSFPYLGRREFLVFASFLFFSIIFSARPGADWKHYLDWDYYFVSFDLSALADYPKSLRDLPLVQWQYGTGLLAAMLHVVFRLPNSMLTTAGLIGVASLLLFIYVARNYSKQWSLLSLALAMLLLFSPAGYYINAYSSEGWIILLTLFGLCCIEWNRSQHRSHYYCAFALSVSCYFLLLVKNTNVVICGALIFVFMCDRCPTFKMIIHEFRSSMRVFITLVSAPIIALGFLATYNYVINGSILASPYLFQDSEYSAISFSQMKVWEILFSPWHGLFFYDPLLLVPIYWCLRSKRETAICFVIIAAFIMQVVIQSSWYCWWMGTGTYGGRGFCGISVLLIYVLMRCHQDRLAGILNSSRSLLILAAFATFEAALIRKGDTNFTDYLSFLRDAVMTWPSSVAKPVCLGSVILFVGRCFTLDLRRCLLAYILGIFPLTVFPIATFLHWVLLRPGVLIGALIAALIMIFSISAFYQTAWFRRFAISISGFSSDGAERLLFIGTIGVLLFSIIFQATMLKTFSSVAVGNFSGGRSFDCKLVVRTFYEYGMIAGYERDKAAMFAFLTKAGCFSDDTSLAVIPAKLSELKNQVQSK